MLKVEGYVKAVDDISFWIYRDVRISRNRMWKIYTGVCAGLMNRHQVVTLKVLILLN